MPGSSVSAPNPLQIPYPKFADGMPKTTQMEGGCSEPPPLKGLQDISLHHEAWQLQRQLEELEAWFWLITQILPDLYRFVGFPMLVANKNAYTGQPKIGDMHQPKMDQFIYPKNEEVTACN